MGRPVRARRSRTTSGSRRACPAPTSRTAPSPRRGGSVPRWCWRATSSASRRAGRCAPSASATVRRSRRGPCSSRRACRTGCSTRRARGAHRSRRLLRRIRERGAVVRRRRRVHRRRRQLRRPGRAEPRSLRPKRRRCSFVPTRWRSRCRGTSSSASAPRANVEVRLQTEVVAGHGDDHLEAITLADRATGTEEVVPTNWLFVFIGASPRTDWLGDDVARDEHGLRRHRPRL